MEPFSNVLFFNLTERYLHRMWFINTKMGHISVDFHVLFSAEGCRLLPQ